MSDMSGQVCRLDSFWMPFTSNRLFKASPQIIESAEGLYYQTKQGDRVLDGASALWCCNLGHGRKEIIEAATRQLQKLDYAPSYQLGHDLPFILAERLLGYLPDEFGQVFFVNSGSEAAETAMKIALAWHQLQGNDQKVRLVGRQKGFHGAGFGAISVGGIENNRRLFPNLLQHTSLLPAIHNPPFVRGEPPADTNQADALLDIIAEHSAETIAAVIVEPVCGSGGVLVPPAGYLRRLRDICDEHNILLIVDEVICALGRLGAPFASTGCYGVIPDIITTAKSLTNGVAPMGAAFIRQNIYDAFMAHNETLVELFHGYTFSANPLSCSVAMACIDICEREGLYHRVNTLSDYWQDAVHSLQGLPHVMDIRNIGLMAGIELEPQSGVLPGQRTWHLFRGCFDQGLLTRANGETLALCPPLIIEKTHIDQMIDIVGQQLKRLN